MTSWKRGLLAGLERTGTEPAARRLQRRLRPRWARLNDADDAAVRRLLLLALPRDACCVDVGANAGELLAAMVDAAPAGQHLAFEPVAALAHQLAVRFPSVEVRTEAVGDRAGEQVFAVHRRIPALSGLRTSLSHALTEQYEEVTVPVVRLDDVLLPRPRTAFVKIDVEGGELQVLQGARALLRRDRPLVVFEHGHGAGPVDLLHSRRVHDELTAAGLVVHLLDGTRLDRTSFLEVYRSGSHWNFVAHG